MQPHPALLISRHHNLVHMGSLGFQTTRLIINALLLCLVVGYIAVCWLPAPCLINRHQLLNPFGSSWGVPDGWGYHKIDCYNIIYIYHHVIYIIYTYLYWKSYEKWMRLGVPPGNLHLFLGETMG